MKEKKFQKILSVGYNFIKSGMGESQYPDPGSGIRDEQAWSYFSPPLLSPVLTKAIYIDGWYFLFSLVHTHFQPE